MAREARPLPREILGSTRGQTSRAFLLPKFMFPRPIIPYIEQLQDIRWLRRRDEILKAADWLCNECDTHSTPAREVHHRYYIKGRYAWEYPDTALVALCKKHHDEAHSVEGEGGMMAWEKMVVKCLEGLWVPTGNDIICSVCFLPITDETAAGKTGRHRFICEKCAVAAEMERKLPL